jgi:hypothetical protein
MLQLARARRRIFATSIIAKDDKMISISRKALLAAPMLFISVESQALEVELYNSYSTDNAKTRVTSVTCGSTPSSSGCYGSAWLGPFRQVCAMVATGVTKTTAPNGSTIYRRQIAIMDRGAVAGAQVRLLFYRETHTVTATGDATVHTGGVRALTLPLVGGPTALCSLARNASGFFVGTNKSPQAVRVSNTFEIIALSGFSPPVPVVAITAMQDGHVAVTHKDDAFGGGATFYRNDGSYDGGGGSESFVVGTQNGAALPIAAPALASAPSTTALLDAKGRAVVHNGNPVVRDSAGVIIREGEQVAHSVRR